MIAQNVVVVVVGGGGGGGGGVVVVVIILLGVDSWLLLLDGLVARRSLVGVPMFLLVDSSEYADAVVVGGDELLLLLL
jgi:hypothetical protein